MTRGNVWLGVVGLCGCCFIAAKAHTVYDDGGVLDRDKDKIRTIDRFSEEYFRLVRANSVAENQVIASQQADEELLIELRGQVYRIR